MDFKNEAQEIYDQLYHTSKHFIRSGKIDIDQNLVHKKKDQRRGLSIIVRPDEHAANEISKFQEKLRSVDDGQYFQPIADLHTTILSVISAYDGFKLENIDPEQYSNVICESLKDHKPFTLTIHGVTCSEGAIMIQGFNHDERLQMLRENLRQSFQQSRLKNSIDSRYSLKTAHLTAVRYLRTLKDPLTYDHLIEKYRDYDFGAFEVSELEFVYHDWYQSRKIVKILRKIKLQHQ
ncbi:2'-5' RNA ligase family protein [Chryseobacterium sp. PBS4-4]|uniref:2'-5' RNA ligase family protein n=1 Tax=Chryseobacterium edaphi TaxID=2976532 RepID=A0ABT2W8E8_9FLAO|nr:2'-5' RNA ligase family protein [Chryseobacterium edaphi]MCU7618493.1 2'-5' RNA ligase family protein [Chryseobacterium edaphi]